MSPIDANEILAALPPQERQQFRDQIQSQTGVALTLTLSPTERKRKHRHNFNSIKGRVIGIRFTDQQFKIVSQRAAASGRSPGDYLKWLATRSHHRPNQTKEQA